MKSETVIRELNNRQRQGGVVLISCVIFLILILLMLRISLHGSMIAEQKVGIDQDIAYAGESAQLALRAAERDIVNVVRKIDVPDCNGASDNSETCNNAQTEAARMAWILAWLPRDATQAEKYKDLNDKAPSYIKLAAANLKTEPGFFDGVAFSQQACKDDTGKNVSAWHCINWGHSLNTEYKGNLTNTGSQEVTLATNTNTTTDIAPRYIVERFLPTDIAGNPNANLLMRVTAVGFGKSGGASGGKNENLTNVVYQANYAF